MKSLTFHFSFCALQFSLILSIASLGVQAAEDLELNRVTIADRIEELLDAAASEGFTGAVLLEQNGNVTLEVAFGLANPEKKSPYTTSTIHQIGSISKQFTAAAAAKLSTEGRLNLHITVDNYLVGHPYLSEITLHELLTHTAGLPDNCGDDFEFRSVEDLLNDCLSEMNPKDKTGEVSYSNLGYSLIAAVIETVSEQPFEDYIRNELLEPLGLQNTGYYFEEREASRLAYGKRNGQPQQANIANKLKELQGEHWNLMGNGGMQSTLADIRLWQSAVMSEDHLFADISALVLTPHVSESENLYLGYGWYIRTNSAGEVRQYSHSGSDGVFFSYLLVRPLQKLALYFVGSNGEDEVLPVLRSILAELPG